MEVELEPRVKALGYKVKAMSRESPSQKAAHVLDTDLRNHWSTATNTKEWILLELDEPCLLSHMRIYNKSVLEWEISVGLRYKPETFVKVRPRCEAPRRDMLYPMNYTPTRYIRVSCLRGNPIAIFYIQVMGVPINGLEAEFQPLVNHLLPNIILHKQDDHDRYIQLLQDMTNRLVTFIPQLEADLNSFSEAPESKLRFLAMLAGPFYSILQIVTEREAARLGNNISDSEGFRNTHQSTILTVSSNFQPRRSRNTSQLISSTSNHLVFRPDTVLTLLRKAYKDSNLGNICRMASRILQRLISPINTEEESSLTNNITDESLNRDYSDLFGEEFKVIDDKWDPNYINVLDISLAEEGILHVLYACSSQPLLCSKLADSTSDLWSALPLVQALLPALRPSFNNTDQIDENFSQWKQTYVQHALSQIVATSSSPIYRPLLRACAGYLSSFSPSHAKAACVLIDLCSGVLAPWIPQVIAKVDLAVELLEDLLGAIQAAHNSFDRARSAIKYFVLALSGNMDDIMSKYKDSKQKILFLVEMLEPYLDPAITPMRNTIAFGNMPSSFLETQEINCEIALNIIRKAIKKSNILPSLEAQWRKGSVAPSVLLSIMEHNLLLPNNIDLRKSSISESMESQCSSSSMVSSFSRNGGALCKSNGLDSFPNSDHNNLDPLDDSSSSLLFAPLELSRMSLTTTFEKSPDSVISDNHSLDYNYNYNHTQLMNFQECELRANEFRNLALELHSETQITPENYQVCVDSLLLAAECYVNPYFLLSLNGKRNVICKEGPSSFQNIDNKVEMFTNSEQKRDKIVIEILLEAAKLDKEVSISYEEGVKMSERDILSADAITLVRNNQGLLCNFLVQRLQKEKDSNEILLQSLVFYLNSATKLYCSPECIVEIILKLGEYFNEKLSNFYYQVKNEGLKMDNIKLLEFQRRWNLIQSLVIASSGGDEGFSRNSKFANLVPNQVWLAKVPEFSVSTSPLVRFFGWMGISRNARDFLHERLFLTSDLSQLTNLLSIFYDELSEIDNGNKHIIYPEISQFLPDLKKQFEGFGEIILEAVTLQLKSLPSSNVPDLLVWFSDLCSWPFVQKSGGEKVNSDSFKGFIAKNAKAVILYILEAIISEHMEEMVPEIPRIVHILVSLCTSIYCDVSFLDSILRLLKPIISYSLKKVAVEESQFEEDSCIGFESLCFNELFENIKNNDLEATEKKYSRALSIFVLASVLPDLSANKKIETVKSLIHWAEFALFEKTGTFHDYLCAYQAFIESCKLVLLETMRIKGVIPLNVSLESSSCIVEEKTWLLSDICNVNLVNLKVFKVSDEDTDLQNNQNNVSSVNLKINEETEIQYNVSSVNLKVFELSDEEIKSFCENLESLISKLSLTLELCYKLHHKLVRKLVSTSGECFVYLKCLLQSIEKNKIDPEFEESEDQTNNFPEHWGVSLESYAEKIVVLQEGYNWEVSSIMLDCLLEVSRWFFIDNNIMGSICSILKNFSSKAPNISLRLRTDKYMSIIFKRGPHANLTDLFTSLINHSEPEQRFFALKHMKNLLVGPTNEILSDLVSKTWDHVTLCATYDVSFNLRIDAIEVLIKSVEFTERAHIQAFLVSADEILKCLTRDIYPNYEGPLIKASLKLLAHISLHTPSEDLDMMSENIWRNIESLAEPLKERSVIGIEQKICQALCKIRSEGDEAKQIMKKVLSSSFVKQQDPKFASTRESVLQAVSGLSSTKAYFDLFAEEIDQKAKELEEAEMEMELLQNEYGIKNSSIDSKDSVKDDQRLKQIKDEIRAIEKSKLREEIIARRQKKLLLKKARQQYLEEAANQEAELLQELDRERSAEVEKEIERQRLIDQERAKSRELRFNLDMEKEKQTQRDLQRELEQVESGVRPSRREYSSSTHSRPRDRYRERENGRGNNTTQQEAPKVVLSGGSRQFSGQLHPVILQAQGQGQDRSDDCGSSYEETYYEGGGGDTGSIGDLEMDGQSSYGSGSSRQHPSSRGGSTKSRQIMERRPGSGTDTTQRREGKWERKHG